MQKLALWLSRPSSRGLSRRLSNRSLSSQHLLSPFTATQKAACVGTGSYGSFLVRGIGRTVIASQSHLGPEKMCLDRREMLVQTPPGSPLLACVSIFQPAMKAIRFQRSTIALGLEISGRLRQWLYSPRPCPLLGALPVILMRPATLRLSIVKEQASKDETTHRGFFRVGSRYVHQRKRLLDS